MAVTLSLIACEQGPRLQETGVLESASDLFSDRQVWDVQIELGDAERASLREHPRQYVGARVIINGHELGRARLRLKGTFSFRPLGGKAAFKLKFKRDEQGQRFLGLAGLTMNNLVQDRALVHERLSYQLYRAAGVPAPRVGYGRVFVDGELYGLYVLIESVDGSFLERTFDDGSGSLYEEHAFTDLRLEDLWDFEQDAGTNETRRDLANLIAAVARPGDGIFSSGLLDTRAFLAFVAVDSILGNWDGYIKSHNYRIYHEPSLNQWSFLPWGLDQALERRTSAFASRGVLAQKCFTSSSCLARYARVGLEVLAELEQIDFSARLDQVAELIEEFVQEDPRKPWPMDKYRRHQDHVHAFVTEHPVSIGEQLRCVVDGGTVEDCRPVGHACVTDDDDCRCEPVEVGGGRFLLCSERLTWSAARAACVVQGAQLAWVDNGEQNAALFEASQRISESSWYIGFNDRDTSDEFVWVSGYSGEFQAWAPGDPDDFGGEDCTVFDRFAGGGWADERCSLTFPYVCRFD